MASVTYGATGVNFSDYQTPNAGQSSELFDHYEEGTWTVQMYGGASQMTLQSITVKYLKLGRLAFCHGTCRRNDSGSYTGVMTMQNLPFTSSDTVSVGGGWWSDGGSDNGHKGQFYVPSDTGTIYPLHGSTGATLSRYTTADGGESAFPNNEYLYFSVEYTTA
tara:strand:+ start:54 stop:542 length:489 start_codon:yes stop_codon:yes gene_type:complete